jgi:hypothetical protein
MKKPSKPLFSGDNGNVSRTRGKLEHPSTWSAIRSLFSITVEKRQPSTFIYLLFTGIPFGVLFIIIGISLLFHFEVNDHRTIILYSILYFIYGFFITLVQNIYLIPLGTARLFFLITFVLFFILTNLLAYCLGFGSIPWE